MFLTKKQKQNIDKTILKDIKHTNKVIDRKGNEKIYLDLKDYKKLNYKEIDKLDDIKILSLKYHKINDKNNVYFYYQLLYFILFILTFLIATPLINLFTNSFTNSLLFLLVFLIFDLIIIVFLYKNTINIIDNYIRKTIYLKTMNKKVYDINKNQILNFKDLINLKESKENFYVFDIKENLQSINDSKKHEDKKLDAQIKLAKSYDVINYRKDKNKLNKILKYLKKKDEIEKLKQIQKQNREIHDESIKILKDFENKRKEQSFEAKLNDLKNQIEEEIN